MARFNATRTYIFCVTIPLPAMPLPRVAHARAWAHARAYVNVGRTCLSSVREDLAPAMA